jgi:hypothetical protein
MQLSPSVGQIEQDVHRAGVPEMTPEAPAELLGSVGVWVERRLGVRVGEVFFSRVSMSRVWGVLLGDCRRVAVKVLGCWFGA